LSYRPTTIERLQLPQPDYDADDILIVAETEQLRALADDVRLQIVKLLRERAQSTTELAAQVGLAKGTVSHHLKVLESAGLIRVVRTRKVRALTESIYGRVARLYVLKGADEGRTSTQVRLSAADARRFQQRLARLRRDIEAASTPRGEEHELVAELVPSRLHT
jgi:DNA-binding transcriptional ArsR family regulator